MAECLISTSELEVISNLPVGNAEGPAEPLFPHFQDHFHGHAGLAPTEWTSREARPA
jgi:hypothetical protein